ncbi:hypothetical protein MRB53_009810 [Persea americana]|uniref:Uncharacterized protein n=1 Tax=Persea americana TaxID=3435 RepID=A0ACC2LQ53_PERAE|nr:hypothetical protein MRB53_009810 [Persea americana]
MMVSSGLLDSGFSGSSFTWSNNRQGKSYVATKLDHSLTNQALSLSFPDGLLQHLVRQNIDHSPILLSSRPPLAARYIPFKFEEMWIGYPSFKDLVATIWNLPGSKNQIDKVEFKGNSLESHPQIKAAVVEFFSDIDKPSPVQMASQLFQVHSKSLSCPKLHSASYPLQ